MKGNLQITNGTLKSNIGQYIKSLPDGSYFWQITKPKRTRSLAENKYYWGIVIKILSDYTGFDPDEMHEVIKYKFLAEKQRIAADRRKKLILPKGTSDLSVAEFEKLMEDVRRWASRDLGCYVPLPNETTTQI